MSRVEHIGNAMLHTGDCLDVLRSLPECFRVNCCITSPPYYGLRDYGTAEWEGGDEDCDHKERTKEKAHSASTLGPKRDGMKPDNAAFKALESQYKHTCKLCGAVRVDHQIGLEQTPDEYVAKLVAVFREVRRVLADDGTLWLNLGDSYAGSAVGGFRPGSGRADGIIDDRNQRNRNGIGCPSGVKPKDLIGIPWRVAFALQADGWYLRQDIIWSKPNPMPESVRDRCTKAHEYLFLLSKSARYWYDAEAIMEDSQDTQLARKARGWSSAEGMQAQWMQKRSPVNNNNGIGERSDERRHTRNRRSVWTVATQPYAEAHFATFPPALIEPCVLAGCPAGGTVLDPFSGSGTTGMVALQQGRKYLGIELNPEYQKLAVERITPAAAQERLFA